MTMDLKSLQNKKGNDENMIFKKKKEFRNLQYGKCYLLNKKKDYYLFYVSDCFMHYVVCNYMDSMGTMMNQEFFEDLKSAKRYFKEKCRGKKW